jgi:hypothetical protein
MRTLTLFLALFIIVGCSRPALIDPPGPPDRPNPIVNGQMLFADMSDARILEAFRIDISKAEARELKGKDGYQTHYTLGSQQVTIVRSAVSGIFIYADGPIQGHWDLETNDVPKY